MVDSVYQLIEVLDGSDGQLGTCSGQPALPDPTCVKWLARPSAATGFAHCYVDLDVHDEVDEINKDNNTIFTTWYAAPRSEPEPEE